MYVHKEGQRIKILDEMVQKLLHQIDKNMRSLIEIGNPLLSTEKLGQNSTMHVELSTVAPRGVEDFIHC